MIGAPRLAAPAACTALLAAFGPCPAQAATINFATPSDTLGTNQASGPVMADGFTAPTNSTHKGELTASRFFGKNGCSEKTGFRLASTSDHEIDAPTGSGTIVLHISALSDQDLRIGFGFVQKAR
jgi:hypothetical protein